MYRRVQVRMYTGRAVLDRDDEATARGHFASTYLTATAGTMTGHAQPNATPAAVPEKTRKPTSNVVSYTLSSMGAVFHGTCTFDAIQHCMCPSFFFGGASQKRRRV